MFLGYVPETLAGVDLWSVTGKLTWLPWVPLGRRWTAWPLTLAAQVTSPSAIASSCSCRITTAPDTTRCRPRCAGTALGAAIGRPAWGFDQVGAYAEVVAVDIPFAYLLSNLGTVRASEVLSIALGIRVGALTRQPSRFSSSPASACARVRGLLRGRSFQATANARHGDTREGAMARDRERRGRAGRRSIGYAVIGLGHIAQVAVLPRSRTRGNSAWSRSSPATEKRESARRRYAVPAVPLLGSR